MSLSDEPRHDLLGRQTLPGMVTACCTTLPSTMVPMTSRRLAFFWNGILAGLEIGTCLQRKHAADEDPGIDVDHALTLQDVGDIALAGPRRNVDDLVFLQRARRFQGLLAVIIRRCRTDHQDDQEGDDGIADHDERIAGALRPPRRRRDLFEAPARRAGFAVKWAAPHSIDAT